MADILKIVFIIIGILIIYVSYWLLAQALFPRLVESASRQYGRPVRLTLIGLAVSVLPVALGIALSKTPNGGLKFLGVTLIVIPGILGLAGSAGLTLRIGRGLPSPIDETQPWRRVLRGGIVLACSFLLPFVGWFIIPLWVLVSGLGAFILALRGIRTDRAADLRELPPEITPTTRDSNLATHEAPAPQIS
jgi:hypothetical protein